jgi:hypothetical protein
LRGYHRFSVVPDLSRHQNTADIMIYMNTAFYCNDKKKINDKVMIFDINLIDSWHYQFHDVRQNLGWFIECLNEIQI